MKSPVQRMFKCLEEIINLTVYYNILLTYLLKLTKNESKQSDK